MAWAKKFKFQVRVSAILESPDRVRICNIE
ncbi:uncharacterized protein G2W53_035201 [Senna tora]|uniref:Uncharacterized protein n=1 Tax=Senna tora TaxID=362788 RepID=A0A834W4P9_9FABA|nr:uncharacterized protein G2W53_035201 [Senna tora]